jgi:hypothetical protein
MFLWPVDSFWRCVGVAVLMAEAELMPVTHDYETIERDVLRAWLDWADPAGHA